MELEISQMVAQKDKLEGQDQQTEVRRQRTTKRQIADNENNSNLHNTGRDYIQPDEQLGFGNNTHSQSLSKDLGTMPFQTGQYVGEGNRRSAKLSLDPVLELKHVIGYSPNKDKGLNVKWSRIPGENIVIFSSGGTIIAMDTETSEQKRFFFGHSAPICCFDVAKQGNLIASA